MPRSAPGSGSYSGPIGGNGSLVKDGSGTLLLSGSSTYTGGTTVNGGMLEVDGSLASLVTVNSGAVLSGTGSLTSVVVNPGGHLDPGDGPGTLNLSGSLTLLAGAVMDYELDTPSTSDEILMSSGSLVLSGQQFSDFNFTWTAKFGPGPTT